MAYRDRDDREEKPKRIKQGWPKCQLKHRLTISRADAEAREAHEIMLQRDANQKDSAAKRKR